MINNSLISKRCISIGIEKHIRILTCYAAFPVIEWIRSPDMRCRLETRFWCWKGYNLIFTPRGPDVMQVVAKSQYTNKDSQYIILKLISKAVTKKITRKFVKRCLSYWSLQSKEMLLAYQLTKDNGKRKLISLNQQRWSMWINLWRM